MVITRGTSRKRLRVIDSSSEEESEGVNDNEIEVEKVLEDELSPPPKRRRLVTPSLTRQQKVVKALQSIATALETATPYVSDAEDDSEAESDIDDDDNEAEGDIEDEAEGDRKEFNEVNEELEEIEEQLNNVYDSTLMEEETAEGISKEQLKFYTKELKNVIGIYKAKTPSILKVLSSHLSLKDKAKLMEHVVLYKNIDDFESKIAEREYIDRYLKENSYSSKEEMERINEIEDKIKDKSDKEVPLKTRILNLNTTDENKMVIYRKYQEYTESLVHETNDSGSLKKWLEYIVNIPFGKYQNNVEEFPNDVYVYLRNARRILDEGIAFMPKVKEEIIHLIATNLKTTKKTKSLALKGKPGIGKTKVGKLIAKAMGRPYKKISLGGLRNACTLKGSNGVWIGSDAGMIVQSLRDTGCMNPVIHFDELDKLSEHEEISGVLTHLIDEMQVESFEDEYFQGVKFDLSGCLFLFSYNDERLVNGILGDRMQKLEIDAPTMSEKVVIAKDYMIPEILESFGFENSNDLVFEDDIIRYIIGKSRVKEAGCRQLRRNLETIISRLNTAHMIQGSSEYNVDDNENIKELVGDNYKFSKHIMFPYVVTVEDVDGLFSEPIDKKSEKLDFIYS